MKGRFLETLVWDNHACMPLRPGDTEFLDQLADVHSAGVDVVSLNISSGKQSYDFAAAVLETYREWIAHRPEQYLLVKSASDAVLAHTTGRLGVCFDVEGGDILERNPRNVARLYDLGVRWMLPVYNTRNELGCGCMAEDTGLTALGREVVSEMNRVGMVVCASHCGHETALDLIECSSAPIIFSHSNAKAVWDHPRNISDDLICACAGRGGVIGINGFAPFLGSDSPGIQRLIDHLIYMIDLVGPDHVGIALDYVFDVSELEAFIASNPDAFPQQYFQAGTQMIRHDQMKDIIRALQARGLSADVVAKVLGENHLRVASTVWR